MTYVDTRDPREVEREWALYDKVRRLRVHDDVHGGYPEAVIGWWDQRGYTYCLDCLTDDAPDPFAIDSGNSAANGESCDFCHVNLQEAALKRTLTLSCCRRCLASRI
jgi:hypothetical protein